MRLEILLELGILMENQTRVDESMEVCEWEDTTYYSIKYRLEPQNRSKYKAESGEKQHA
jgi:hypothetical protein